MFCAEADGHKKEIQPFELKKADIEMDEEMDIDGSQLWEKELERHGVRDGNRCGGGAKVRPRLVDYESDEDDNTNMNENDDEEYYEQRQSSLSIYGRNNSISSSKILSPSQTRASHAPQPFSTPTSPTYPSSSGYSDPPVSSTTSKRVPNTTHHDLPAIRRVIAQQGEQARVEYYPQWISRVWLKANTPTTVWEEWKKLKADDESVLCYTPLTGRSDRTTAKASNATPISGSARKSKGRRGEWIETDRVKEKKDEKLTMRPWKVLRSEVSNDNDSGAYLAAMLSEAVTLAIVEASTRTLHHVLSSPVEFVSGTGSKRRAAELLGRNGMDFNISTFLRHLVKLSPKERRKFESVKVRWMGQVDPRVTLTQRRTHNVSVVAYVTPVCEGWKHPLLQMQASDYFRDMAFSPTSTSKFSNCNSEIEVPSHSGYETLLHHKRLLLALLTTCPWFISPTSHLTALAWLLIPRRQLKHTFNSFGVTLPDDWHNHQREQYLCRYSEVVQDKRSWHDLMETSLFLNKHFKELKMAEVGQRDEWITDDEGDSDVEDEHPCAGVTAANMRKRRHDMQIKGTAKERSLKKTGKGKKRAASEMDIEDKDITERRSSEIEENDEDDDDDEYDDTRAAEDATTDTDDDEEYEIIAPVGKRAPAPLAIKSASSKAPRRAVMVDPDARPLGKNSKTSVVKARLAARNKDRVASIVEGLTEEEWRMIRASRAKKEAY